MNITEVLDLVNLKGTITGRDIKDAVVNCLQSRQIDLKNLRENISLFLSYLRFGHIHNEGCDNSNSNREEKAKIPNLEERGCQNRKTVKTRVRIRKLRTRRGGARTSNRKANKRFGQTSSSRVRFNTVQCMEMASPEPFLYKEEIATPNRTWSLA
ncbi:hypothetical protein TNCV_2628431 [Trichonephila clavipes]|nr:hypothetical protein TNCV_2628431 [Trichonephila clavipes]